MLNFDLVRTFVNLKLFLWVLTMGLKVIGSVLSLSK